MNKKLLLVLVLSFAAVLLTACGGSTVTVSPGQGQSAQQLVGEGLDLQAVGALMSRATDASQLEQLINDPSSQVNNLDLDGDENIDYISVREVNDGGTLVYQLIDASVQAQPTLASITVTPNGSGATVQYLGAPEYYGPNAVYISHMNTGQMLFLAWALRPHSAYYVSPYHYGLFPGYYHPSHIIARRDYVTRTQTVVKTVKTAPPQRASAPEIRAKSAPDVSRAVPPVPQRSLSNPNGTQRQFDPRTGQGRDTVDKSRITTGSSNPKPAAAPAPKPMAPPAPKTFGGAKKRP